MALFAAGLGHATEDYSVEPTDDGFVIIARPGREGRFSDLVRRIMNDAAADCVVFPVSDGEAGYERAVVIPLED